jgi:hypothetical protein
MCGVVHKGALQFKGLFYFTGFSPVAVVQQYNRQVTHITHKQITNTIQKHNNKWQYYSQHINKNSQLQQIKQKENLNIY